MSGRFIFDAGRVFQKVTAVANANDTRLESSVLHTYYMQRRPTRGMGMSFPVTPRTRQSETYITPWCPGIRHTSPSAENAFLAQNPIAGHSRILLPACLHRTKSSIDDGQGRHRATKNNRSPYELVIIGIWQGEHPIRFIDKRVPTVTISGKPGIHIQHSVL
jgi:hypothetical protein